MQLTLLTDSIYMNKKMADELEGCHVLMNEVCSDIGYLGIQFTSRQQYWNGEHVMKYVADKSLQLSN